ncbi:hypothetical protein BJEO58_00769 [Brevibacterium jeotgali]|uniref:Uncharacterized protein n=1 Tax=Brevibacterium jeotgali TaxID=1262550 RepID=A0A2H1L2R7_9MICO|nr:hypothetical protein FB108_1070 [Brevibacterium jeotgali]SMY11186.1 hypothetical protein BJEO58_00769 [Brevibacterium jeotgali]
MTLLPLATLVTLGLLLLPLWQEGPTMRTQAFGIGLGGTRVFADETSGEGGLPWRAAFWAQPPG